MNNMKIQGQGAIKMNARPRMKIIALSIGLVLAQMSAEALADSAVGADTVLGNAYNPGGVNPVALQSDGARDTEAAPVKRTPTGQMYNYPYAPGENEAVSASIEVGVTSSTGEKGAALNSMYRDVKTGNAGVSVFGLSAEKADTASFVEVVGGNPATKDQFISVSVGKYNDWKAKLFYSETKHVFTSTWQSLFSGEGTGNLTTGLAIPLMVVPSGTPSGTGYVGAATACTPTKPCWSYNGLIYGNSVAVNNINGQAGVYAAGGTTGGLLNTTATPSNPTGQSGQANDIAIKLAKTPQSELSLVRAKGGVRYDKTLDNAWKVYASYSNEQRTGARPFAMNESNWSTEIAEPINYNTHDWLAGFSYVEGVNRANVNLSVTNFRNNIKQLDVQYPVLQTNSPLGVINTATFALAPDNNAINLKGEFVRDLPNFYKGKFTAAASWGSNRQNDTLINPISDAQSNELAAYGVTTIVGVANPGYTTDALVNNWNGVNGSPLSRKTSDQRIDNSMLNFSLSLKPTDNLGLKGSYRSVKTDNKGGYTAYNPLTGQFGRGFTDNQGVAKLEVVTALATGATPGAANSCGSITGAPITGCTFSAGGAAASGAFYTATGSNSPVYDPARSIKQNNLNLAADYTINATSSANGEIEREDVYRTFRERDKTWENKIKLGYTNRALANTSLRLSWEADNKRGSEYNYRSFYLYGQGVPGLTIADLLANANAAGDTIYGLQKTTTIGTGANSTVYPSNALPGLFNQQSSYFRKLDQADRDQNILNARLNIAALDNLDVGAFAQIKQVKYPNSIYGVQSNDQNSLSLDANYQASASQSIGGYLSHQEAKRVLNGNTVLGGALVTVNPISGPGAATGIAVACSLAQAQAAVASGNYSACSDSNRPASANYTNETKDSNNVLGLSYQNDFGKVRLVVDYSYSQSKTSSANTYGTTALAGQTATVSATTAAANQATMTAYIQANPMPDMTFTAQDLNVNLFIPMSKTTTVRVYDRYAVGNVSDWHYNGINHSGVNAFDSGTLLLDSGAQNYHVNTVGVYLTHKM